MNETPDVCVVGGGPAGLTTARTLGAAGRRVVLLESGGFDSSPAVQELNDGDYEGDPYLGLGLTRTRGLGGTANDWDVRIDGKPGAKYVPLSARDMRDWPIRADELKPHYVEAQRVCGLGPLEYGAAYWTAPARRPFELDGTGLTSGVYQFGYAERFTRELVGELRAMESVSVVAGTVVDLSIDRSSWQLSAVRAIDGDGRLLELKARIVILACGAVENARLLLLADFGGGGSSEWLGRCFMEHARDFSMVLVPDSPELFANAAFYDFWTMEDGAQVGGCIALTEEALDRFQLPNGAMTLVPQIRRRANRLLAARAPAPLRRALRMAPNGRYGWSRVRSPERTFDRFQIVLNLEQRPHPSNRIELSTRRDRFGNPLPRLVLRWTDEEQERLENLRELLREWFSVAGLGSLKTEEGRRRPDLNGHHHAGTTRMAFDRRDGAVDPNGRVFGVENLYVVGGSVFPSAGFANPTLTIVALALRLARHLDHLLR
jgi:choline dehydrogenase-like flavoprotein